MSEAPLRRLKRRWDGVQNAMNVGDKHYGLFPLSYLGG
jgi:hypothetical protein